MKKFFTSKPFIVAALAFLCIAIVAICIFVSRDQQPEFVPEPLPQSTPSENWTEAGSSSAKPSAPNIPASEDKQEAYPKVTEDDGKDVVIEFTPPQSSEVETPEVPVGKTEIPKPQQKPKASHPVNPDTNVKPPEPKPKEPSGPAPGSTNDKGQVYDAAFGWVTPSQTTTIPSDNDGDPNKIVGSMD